MIAHVRSVRVDVAVAVASSSEQHMLEGMVRNATIPSFIIHLSYHSKLEVAHEGALAPTH